MPAGRNKNPQSGIKIRWLCEPGKNRHFFMPRNLRILAQRERFGRLQNGSPPFGICAASHSSQSVWRGQVVFGQGQSGRITGIVRNLAAGMLNLLYLQQAPSSPGVFGSIQQLPPSCGSPRWEFLPFQGISALQNSFLRDRVFRQTGLM